MISSTWHQRIQALLSRGLQLSILHNFLGLPRTHNHHYKQVAIKMAVFLSSGLRGPTTSFVHIQVALIITQSHLYVFCRPDWKAPMATWDVNTSAHQ
jgi:hypothetical protein